jgi:tetraacyldisaccharide 4'-kinase
MECNHDPSHLVDAFTRERHDLRKLRGMKVLALSGIASPLSFENTMRDLGAEIVETRRYADHHRYTDQEVLDIVNAAQTLGCDAVVTTEKDAVRMTLRAAPPIPVYYLRIKVKFLDGEAHFRRFVRDIIAP